MIPLRDDMLVEQFLDGAKISDHALLGITVGDDGITAQRYLNRVAVPVQVTAEIIVGGDAMTRIELETARDAHEMTALKKRAKCSTGPLPGRVYCRCGRSG